jgi:competence ComEA-like helix-hairpin-helix protein
METFKDLIYHTKSEKRSIFLLVILISILTLGREYLLSMNKAEIEDLCYLEGILELKEETKPKNKFKKTTFKKRSKYDIESKKTLSHKELKTSHFNGKINPNTASEDSLKLLGLSSFAVSNLIKYREKGGKIKYSSQLTKIYGIDSSTFFNIKDKISIPKPDVSDTFIVAEALETIDKSIDSNTFAKAKTEKKSILIDINTADEIQLQYVNGIGPSFAKRIIKYRDLVGGYHSKGQLLEVYGLDHSKFHQIKDQITIGGKVQDINVNSSDYKALSNHPYINRQEARLIVAYTSKHGPLKHAYDIVKIGVMDSLFVEKIMPYLPDSLRHQNAQTPLTSL